MAFGRNLKSSEMKHLQRLDPLLFDMLEQADGARLRQACVLSCEFAVALNEPFESLVVDALESLRQRQLYRSGVIDQLDDLMNFLDDKYFDLKERAEEAGSDQEQMIKQYDEYFRKARTVAALRYAADQDPFEAATETIYEAAASAPDNRVLFDSLKKLLAS